MFHSKSKNKNVHPILKHTIYLGATTNKVVHSTETPCSDAYLIPIDARWYIRSIPEGGNYAKCPKCFPTLGDKN